MNFNINHDDEDRVSPDITTTTYSLIDEVARRRKEIDRASGSLVDQQRRDIMTGIEQADLGEVIRFDDDTAEQIKAVARRRLAVLRSR